MKKFTLKKKEILSSKKQIEKLFFEGKDYFKFPFKLVYIIKDRENEDDSPALFSISVPKRKIKTAVERNLIKRRTREAYRLNKHIMLSKIPNNKQLVFMLVYVSGKAERFEVIQRAVLALFRFF